MVQVTKSKLASMTVKQIKAAIANGGIVLYTGTNTPINYYAYVGPVANYPLPTPPPNANTTNVEGEKWAGAALYGGTSK